MIRILCVDDDQLARHYLVTRLSLEEDFTLLPAAADVESALEALRTEPVDVALLDQHLIGCTGLELLEQLSQNRLRPILGEPRVLFCTGWATPEWEEQAREAGAAGVVRKEDVHHELVEAVRTVAAGGSWFHTADSPSAGSTPTQWRILVAEQDRATRLVLTQALEQIGCRVDFAWDGAEVLDRLESARYQLCFLSHRLPGPPRATEVLDIVEARWPTLRVLLVAPEMARLEVPRSRAVCGLLARPFDPRSIHEQLLKVVEV